MMAISFPGGDVAVTQPSRAELEDSALAWLSLAQTQVGAVQYWAEQGDRMPETIAAIETLRSQVSHALRALDEARR